MWNSMLMVFREPWNHERFNSLIYINVLPFKIAIFYLYFSWIGRMQYFFLKGYWHEVYCRVKINQYDGCVKLSYFVPQCWIILKKNYNKIQELTSIIVTHVCHSDLQNSRVPKGCPSPWQQRILRRRTWISWFSWPTSLIIWFITGHQTHNGRNAIWISKFCRDKEKNWILN